ncbi:DNA polymerase III subunit gamma/tau [Natronogracilivirga saccharolytica]|uniref:DNA polymerase III subunit gamma/tau n=1 Tax=Natronogracilivirga saccharolytica TaxID=2812953 RepID=A0A8J7RR90_9BACT|nr:DNA polymerase III subunit gamma/tau [Natronogracilivirga saccharolytica]MBP3191502.1 DNA polymerase III subunit gamma/tau [Natronogracilivirga saccharolytica]
MSTSYKALTRAYRPQTFEDIVSQEHVSNTLKNAIANERLSHAYLFCGPRGVGKTTMARVLARTINEVDMNVDGEELNNTLNIIEIDAASNNSVEDIRSLRERVRIPPQSGRYKVYIIDEIHMLSKAAFNALLKTLEEPPAHVIFIFATTEPHRILPTILSRCQRFDFRRITVEEIVDRLKTIAEKESIEIDTESLHVIAKKADGALRDALGILDQAVAFCGTSISYDELHRALNIVSTERMFELTDALIRKDARAGMALLHNLLHIGNDIQEFLGALTEHFRNMYLAKDSQNFYLIEATDDTKQRFQKIASHFSEDDLMRMMHIVHEAEFSIRNAQQPRIHLEVTLLKLFHMSRTDGLRELVLKLDQLEQKVTSDSPGGDTGKAGPEQDSPGHGGKPSQSAEEAAKQKPQPPPRKEKPAPSSASQNVGTGDRSGSTAEPGGQVRDEPDIFGTPTLKRPKNHLSAVSLPDKNADTASGHGEIRGNLALSPKPDPEKSGETAQSGQNPLPQETKRKPLRQAENLDEITEIWPDYLETLRSSVSNMLYFSIQKTRPVALDKGLVTLECSDSFTSDIIREQHRKLCDVLKEHFGYALRFTSQLVEQEKRSDNVHDPYEHFAELQKKDPALRRIVELFGAELEY